MTALARRGLTILEAKQTIEELLERCQTAVTLPMVEEIGVVIDDLKNAGVFALHLAPSTLGRLRVRPPAMRLPSVPRVGSTRAVRYVATRGPRRPNVLLG